MAYRAGVTAAHPASASNKVNGRKGSKKVRTGCLTCKVRKVKCDETKPACLRCCNTGRTCSGYQVAKRRKHASNGPDFLQDMSLLGALSTLPEFENSGEQRSFQFFRHFTAPSFASDYDSGFWTALVLKFCHSEPSVRHAVLAVSSLHESLVQDGPAVSDGLAEKQVFALQQYNKAISLLREQMNDPDKCGPIVPLLMCLLFVCMEFMQRKEVESLEYLQQGRQLLHQLVDSHYLDDHQLDLIRQHIVPMYTRSGMTAYLFGSDILPVPVPLNMFLEIPRVFRSIQQARHVFYAIIDCALRWRFAWKSTHSGSESPPPAETIEQLEMEQRNLLSRLSRWNASFSVFLATNSNGSSPAPSALLLQIYYHSATIWTSTATSESETDFDKYIDSFSTILPLATAYLATTGSNAQKSHNKRHHKSNDSTAGATPGHPHQGWTFDDILSEGNKLAFAFETGVIPILYFTAVKCRHPQIRIAAVNLLQKCHQRQENLWQAQSIGRVAARVVEIEISAARDLQQQASQAPPSQVPSRGSVSHTKSTNIAEGQVDHIHPAYDPLCVRPSSVEERREHASNNVYWHAAAENSISNTSSNSHYGDNVIEGCEHPSSSYDSSNPIMTFDLPLDIDFTHVDVSLYSSEYLVPDPNKARENAPLSDTYTSPSLLGSTPPLSEFEDHSDFMSSRIGLGIDNMQQSDSVRGEQQWPPGQHSIPLPSVMSRSVSEQLPEDGDSDHMLDTLEAPFGLPEAWRVSDAVVGPYETEGLWVTFYRKPNDFNRKWDAWVEFVDTT